MAPKASRAKKEDAPKREKKEKKVKDPNAPKKPCGAYMWFCKEKREEVKKENPDFSVTDIGKELGRLWKEESDDAKQKFYKQAEADKDRYKRDMEEYNAKGDDDEEEDDE